MPWRNRIKSKAIWLLFVVAACNSPSVRTRGGCQIIEEPGFTSQHVFKITTTGAPSPTSTSMIQRKTEAEDAAILCAQTYILDKYYGTTIYGQTKPKNQAELRAQERASREQKAFAGVVKGGFVEKKEYDHNQNCEIVFVIEQRNLRKKLSKQ